MRKKLAITLVLTFIIILSFCSCNLQSDDYFGFSKQDFTVVEEEDTHSGFHGDGDYYLILDCSNNEETALEIVDGWKRLPLSENLELIMYGGEKDGVIYEYNLCEKAHLPLIKNGYYWFNDRNSEGKDLTDDSELFSRGSFNFSLALYDCDTSTFYYFEFDT